MVEQAVDAPFVFPFRTEKQHYLFDINTRRILRVGKGMYDLVQDIGLLSPEAIHAKHDGQYTQPQIEAAIEAVRDFQGKGLLLPNRIQEIVAPDTENVADELESKRQQLILEVTTACNFRCTYCVFGQEEGTFRPHGNEKMPWNVAKMAIDDFMGHNSHAEHCAISFYGGEPLLNLPLIRTCVDYINQQYANRRPTFSLTTNGYLLRDEAIEFLVSNRFNISISIDGPQAVHDACRRTKEGHNTWEVVTGNLRRFLDVSREKHGSDYLIINAVGGLETDFEQVVTYFKEADFCLENFSLLFAPDRAVASTARPGCRLYDSFREVLLDFDEQLVSGKAKTDSNAFQICSALLCQDLLEFHKRRLLKCDDGICKILHRTCTPGARRQFTTVDGVYMPCERVERLESLAIGSCKTGVDLAKVQSLLNRWAAFPGCKTCWCATTCNVGCLASVAVDPYSNCRSRQEACENHRKQKHSLLVRYCKLLESNPKALDFSKNTEAL